jgi:hypothetical protein
VVRVASQILSIQYLRPAPAAGGHDRAPQELQGMCGHKQNGIPPAGDIARRGAHLYEERLRRVLEPQHNGKYVVIDVETGEYEIDADHLAASDRAAAKRPGAPLYATRVGARTLGRVGAISKAVR